MKTFTYAIILCTIIIGGACRSVEKMVDEGRYDDAIHFATKKLSGQEKGKTKYVKGLEEAFAKVNHRDLARIQFLKSKADPSLWDDIYNISLRVEGRQNAIMPFLPLTSKEGYIASFNFENTNALLIEARTKAAEYHYGYAKKLLLRAEEEGNKILARNAYDAFGRISKYYLEYKDVSALKDVSHKFGTMHVLIKWDNLDEHRLPHGISNSIEELPTSRLDKLWVKYYSREDKSEAFDFVVNLVIDELEISPEKELVDRFNETNRVERWVDLVDRNGIVKDSLGNPLKTKVIDEYNAQVVKITRLKTARIVGLLELRDFETGKLLEKSAQEIVVDFRDDGCSFYGDRKALGPESLRLLERNLNIFPSDYAMIEEGLNKLSKRFEYSIRSFNL